MIPFDGHYTREQWMRGIRLAMHPTGRGLVLRLVASVLALAGIAFIGVSFFQGETSELRLLRATISIVILTYWISFPYLRAWRAGTRSWRAAAGRLSLKGFANSEGIVCNASATRAVEEWDTFVRAHVREDMVVLVGVNGLATVLPRDFFATEDDWQDFRQLVVFNVVEPK